MFHLLNISPGLEHVWYGKVKVKVWYKKDSLKVVEDISYWVYWSLSDLRLKRTLSDFLKKKKVSF